MKPKFSILILISSFLLIGFLGISGVLPVEHGNHHLCPISVITGNNCSPSESTLAGHHVSGLQSFFQSIAVINFTTGILTAFILLATLLISNTRNQISAEQRMLIPQQFRESNKPNFEIRRKFLHWFSLHNKIDFNTPQRVYSNSFI